MLGAMEASGEPIIRFPAVDRCPDCFGKKLIRGLPCETCEGSGTVVYTEFDSAYAAEVFAAHADWDKGILPESGGANDQAAPMMQAIHFLASIFAREQQEEMEKSRREIESAKTGRQRLRA